MTVLRIVFPAGRYHATPWGHHVNEGLVEWPPSPWRLLRALMSVGFSQEGWSSLTDLPIDAKSLLETLASVLPQYRLPPAGVAHTRHYLPISVGADQKTTKVIDAFATVAEGVLWIHYPINLPTDQRALLARLATGLAYLGRAESWAEAVLVDPSDPIPDDGWSVPLVDGDVLEPGWETVTVIASLAADTYQTWRTKRLAVAETPTSSKPKAKKAPDLAPENLIACLGADTALLQKQGWSQPPGSRMVLYRRPVGSLEPAVPRPQRVTSVRAPVEAALLTLSPNTVRGTHLPSITRCVPQAEHLHGALVRLLGPQASHVVLSGRRIDGTPAEGHGHAHLLPLDLDGGGALDHVLLWAPDGFDGTAQDAILRLRRTYGKDVPELVVTCAGFGSLSDLRNQVQDRRGRCPGILGDRIDGRARVWTSLTPFIAPRFTKPSGKNRIIGQVEAECQVRGLPVPTIEELPREEIVARDFLRFIRKRGDGHPQPPVTVPYALTLTFPEPVAGPIALGYGSHFGLGLFVAVE